MSESKYRFMTDSFYFILVFELDNVIGRSGGKIVGISPK